MQFDIPLIYGPQFGDSFEKLCPFGFEEDEPGYRGEEHGAGHARGEKDLSDVGTVGRALGDEQTEGYQWVSD